MFNASFHRGCKKQSDIVLSSCSFILTCGETGHYFTNDGISTFKNMETNDVKDFWKSPGGNMIGKVFFFFSSITVKKIMAG